MSYAGSKEWFGIWRFDSRHHLGLGDVRLTVGQQEEIADHVAALTADLDCCREALKERDDEISRLEALLDDI